jgi:putative ABC transport system substrate-binding protein
MTKIAIANYGPHASLDDTIKGIKQGLSALGYIENQNVKYDILHINFDRTLLPQTLTKLKSGKPDIVVSLSTPVSQAAKHYFKEIPLVFTDVTDPVSAGLTNQANVTGVSEKQDLSGVVTLAKGVLPTVKKVGLLYSTGDDNDQALLNSFKKIALAQKIELVALPIDQPRDIPVRMQAFRTKKVDFIYVGTSGPIQPSLPIIASIANQLSIPVFNADCDAVKHHQAFACYGVSYIALGKKTAIVIDKIANGQSPKNIPIYYPAIQDHEAFISAKMASKLHIPLPKIHPNQNIKVVP